MQSMENDHSYLIRFLYKEAIEDGAYIFNVTDKHIGRK